MVVSQKDWSKNAYSVKKDWGRNGSKINEDMEWGNGNTIFILYYIRETVND